MLKILKVSGFSLEPDFQDGDYVLIARWPGWAPRVGQVVALHQPTYGTLLKRVWSLDRAAGTVEVRGQHPHSVDSRTFGPVPMRSLMGRVIWKISKPAAHPPLNDEGKD